MIVDSTVLVDAIRGMSKAKEFLESTNEDLRVSRAGAMELVRGSRTKEDIMIVERLMKGLNIEVVEISEDISREAGGMFEKFWHSHGIGVMDAFIAATAMTLGEKLVTHNLKHFKFIEGLELQVPY